MIMDIKKVLLVRSLKKIANNQSCLSHSNKHKSQIFKNSPYVKGSSEKLRRIFRTQKIDQLSALRKLFCEPNDSSGYKR